MVISKITAGVLCATSIAFVSNHATGAMTFLHHFNDTSGFDVSSANGDYAAGDSTATSAGSPGHDSGFFTSSSSNNALYLTAGSQSIAFDAIDNVDATSGGITVGAWFKFSATTGLNPAGTLITIGDTAVGDYALIDYGNGSKLKPRLEYKDNSDADKKFPMASSNVTASDWVYVAATINLTDDLIAIYAYSNAGSLVGGTPITMATNGFEWDASAGTIKLGGQFGANATGLWIDELSIDNTALTQPEIEQRLVTMISGEELSVPEPASAAAVSLMMLGVLGRRRR